MTATPRALGFRMPAEWERQHAIWLAWPRNSITWPGGLLEEVRETYIAFMHALHTGQKIHLTVTDAETAADVRARLRKSGIALEQVVMFVIDYQDGWIRDYGPTYVVHDTTGERAMVKWTFNAWGNKYDDLKADNGVPAQIRERFPLRMFDPDIVLEGGSIEVNGTGTVITTEQCLLHPNRNPGLTRTEIEQRLRDYLNVSNVLWLHEGIAGDDTDGHIDDITRFVNRDTVVTVVEEDPADENHLPLRDNLERLQTMTDETGRPLRVARLPMPGVVGDSEGRLPASYANFYIGNAAVVVPVFDHANDQRALDILQGCFQTRRVVGVNCRSMVHGLGTLHCGSQQEPASPAPR